MGFTVLIPARMQSTRLPGKPLADMGGQPMVVRVAQRAAQSAAHRVVVATDDGRIASACAQAGVAAVLTRVDHPSGSDRLAEACRLLALDGQEIVVNVQGDEPLIEPGLINAVAALLEQNSRVPMGTAACAIDSVHDFASADVVKVVRNAAGLAQYFSRAPIPFARGQQADAAWWKDAACARLHAPLRHIGIYSYRAAFLQQLAALPPAPTELAESLEQLRALWHGFDIAVHVCSAAPGPGVDTPHDLERARELWARQQAARA